MSDGSADRSAPPGSPRTDAGPPSHRQAARTPPPPAARDPLRRTRISTLWIGVIVFAVVLVPVLIFTLQNTQPVRISFFAADGEVPLAVATLLASAAGMLLTAIAGALRIRQLRKRLPRADRTRPPHPAGPRATSQRARPITRRGTGDIDRE